MRNSAFWNTVYKIYPPFLRILERFGFHKTRQKYHVGYLAPQYKADDLKKNLLEKDFENAILTWRDPSEILNMRKIDAEIYQYHLRIFEDGEIRGHYEYSSEGNPWGHIVETCFEPRLDYFKELLGKIIAEKSPGESS